VAGRTTVIVNERKAVGVFVDGIRRHYLGRDRDPFSKDCDKRDNI
jgi:hypothetical protein